MRRAWSLPVLVLLLAAAGCTSTKERYEKGQELETRGDFAEAARYYIQVLEREPTWEDARQRLRVVGTRAVEDHREEARAHEQVGRYAEAVAVLDRLDRLRRAAAGVGATLAVPDDYAAYRRELIDRAVLNLIAQAEEAERRGDWNAALRAYEQALQRYDMPPEQERELVQARARLYVRWGEQELARKHYRAAYDRARQALDVLGPPAGPLADAAHDLQEAALVEGTHYVAFFPVRLPPFLGRVVPGGFLQALNDELQYQYWTAPPPFLVGTDPVELRRELRRVRYDRLTVRQAAEIGRVLEADFVVLDDLDAFEQKELNLREERRPARTRGRIPQDTSFVVQRFTVALEARVKYALVDPRTLSVLEEGTVRAAASGPAERGHYAGDARDLDLSYRDERLFDPGALAEAQRETEDRLLEELAARLSQRVFQQLLARIP